MATTANDAKNEKKNLSVLFIVLFVNCNSILTSSTGMVGYRQMVIYRRCKKQLSTVTSPYFNTLKRTIYIASFLAVDRQRSDGILN
jgi:hypothetical protein